MTSRIRSWLRSLFRRRQIEREMQDEMEDHLARATELLIERGLTPAEARRTAMREFGNLAYLQEEGRIARGHLWVEQIAADARFAWRHFGRNRGVTATILAVLALGIAVNVGLFSLALTLTAPPAGVSENEDLVRIRGSYTQPRDVEPGGRLLSREELELYAGRENREFRSVAGWTTETVWIEPGDVGDRMPASAIYVTPNFFPVLGIEPHLGRRLAGAESAPRGADLEAMISHETWERLFGSDPGVIGAPITINGSIFTIVGIAPSTFKGLREGATESDVLWLPLSARSVLHPGASENAEVFRAVAQLSPGVTTKAATAAVTGIAARTGASTFRFPVTEFETEIRPRIPGAEVVPLTWTNDHPSSDGELRVMYLTFGVIGMLALLVTCTNVSALLTGIALARRREIVARLSLGATRRRLVRQLITESSVLTVAAAGLALFLIWVAARLLNAYEGFSPVPIALPGSAAIFTFALALGVGILFGLSPALHATRTSISSALKDAGTNVPASRARLQRVFVVIQIACTQPLMVALMAMLMGLSFDNQGAVPDELADHLIPLRLSAVDRGAAAGGSEGRPRLDAELRVLRERLSAIPGVTDVVGLFGSRPGNDGLSVHESDRVPGGQHETVDANWEVVESGFLGMTGIPIVRGRDFGPEEEWIEGTEVPVILSAEVAGNLWPGTDPIGRRLQRTGDASTTFVVIGLAQPRTMTDPDESVVYFPPDSRGGEPLSFLLRTSGPADAVVPLIGAMIQREASQVTIRDSRTLGQIQRADSDEARRAMVAVTAGVVLILLLAAIGLFSVIRFSVQQRSGEIAVRMAVGAIGRQVRRLFVAEGLRLGVLGLLLGLPASLLGLYWLASQEIDFSGIRIADVALFVSLAIVGVATAAAWLPSSRASRMDPAAVLRRD